MIACFATGAGGRETSCPCRARKNSPADENRCPGSFAKAEIQTTTTTGVVTVPTSALVTFAGIQKVFTVKDNKAVERPVVTGQREEDWVEITEGLKAGEMVVAMPGNLVTGQPVSIEK